MYKCKSCGRWFDEPKQYVEQYYYGAYLTEEGCPYCRGDFEEITPCKGCGEEFGESELTEGFCLACELKIQNKTWEFIFEKFTQEEIDYLIETDYINTRN